VPAGLALPGDRGHLDVLRVALRPYNFGIPEHETHIRPLIATSKGRFLQVRSDEPPPERVPPQLVPWWYMLAPSSSLRPGEARRFEVGGEQIVLFRGRESRTVRAIPAHCAHQGVDLSHGDVVGDRLRCPLHHWLYGDACESIPGRAEVPAELRRRQFSAAEKFGMIFVYLGANPPLPIPSFSGVDPETLFFVSGKPAFIDCPWFVPVANAFDMAHLGSVHRRRLHCEPEIDRPDAMTFRIRYATSVTGDGWSDRAMRALSGDDIRNVVTCAGGSMVVVEATVGTRRSFLIVSLRPVSGGVSLLPLVGVPRRPSGLHVIHAHLAKLLFIAFLRRDVRALQGIRFHPRFDDERDATLDACYQYLCDLPRFEREET
jgi:nitrite reductase/ring-hydroxylating ferredoxin subunit